MPSTSTIGVDVGGTKTHIAVVEAGARRDVLVPSADWRRGQLFDDPGNLTRLVELITATVPGPYRIAVGLHGLDTDEQRANAVGELTRRLPGSVHVVNDAELLGPAAGLTECLKLIVGTGAIALGTTDDGTLLAADGHGSLLGDVGSGPALVRETVRAGLRLADTHSPEAALDDPAIALLCAAYGTPTPGELAVAVTADDPYHWGRHAPLVFDALHRGSRLAATVLDQAADALAGNLAALRRRGARGDVVVGAGGVLTAQGELQSRLTARLSVRAPGLTLRVLATPPVDGALVLADRL
ncbi:hypothetical protein [Actinoplanes derwentensis]|uniref:BadF-type ATPase n=1 Tax=Actinoplanes derwentensis TaxID=113562 RepID=A0A1H1SU27_9ACTN|nr:hypothetical protein [Actinoplanes derwentensis]GID83208.1 ATPase [Actinoplanes derwentensis]SDS51492.1 BadF-type ATPase [Actinoplanes derwentensis]